MCARCDEESFLIVKLRKSSNIPAHDAFFFMRNFLKQKVKFIKKKNNL